MRYLFLIILLSVGAQVFADHVWHESKVKWIYPQANGSIVITFENSSARCLNGNAYYYLKVGENHVTEEALDKYYSLALSAALSGKPLHVNFDTSSNECFINRMFVNFL